MPTTVFGLPRCLSGKESTCQAGDAEDLSSILGSGRSPGEGYGNPLQYPCLENSKDRGAWGHSPWGRKELDTTEHLSMHNSLCHSGCSGEHLKSEIQEIPVSSVIRILGFHHSGPGSIPENLATLPKRKQKLQRQRKKQKRETPIHLLDFFQLDRETPLGFLGFFSKFNMHQGSERLAPNNCKY